MCVRCGSVVDDIRRKCYCGCGPELTVATSHRCVVCDHEVALTNEEVAMMRAQGIGFYGEATRVCPGCRQPTPVGWFMDETSTWAGHCSNCYTNYH
jgi:hypothetical protein